jgi:large repetitive protein
VDTTAPETTIETRLDPVTPSSEASFGFDSNEPGSSFECSLDGAEFTACEAPREYTDVAAGAHQFRVRAVDLAGNVGSPASYDWTVEAAAPAPDTTIDSGPGATTTSTRATFGFSADALGSSFECSLDGAAFAACASPREYTDLAIGTHEFQVRALSADGTPDASPASYPWTVEAPPTCGGDPVTASASADSWTDQNNRSVNHGSEATLKVKSRDSRRNRALVKFAHPVRPSGCVVESAKLRLYSSTFTPNRTLQALRLAGPWSEGTVNWNNQPPPTGTAATAPSRSSAGYVEFDVTAQVRAMYDGVNLGFTIRDANETAGSDKVQLFESREPGSEHPPELVITFG